MSLSQRNSSLPFGQNDFFLKKQFGQESKPQTARKWSVRPLGQAPAREASFVLSCSRLLAPGPTVKGTAGRQVHGPCPSANRESRESACSTLGCLQSPACTSKESRKRGKGRGRKINTSLHFTWDRTALLTVKITFFPHPRGGPRGGGRGWGGRRRGAWGGGGGAGP